MERFDDLVRQLEGAVSKGAPPHEVASLVARVALAAVEAQGECRRGGGGYAQLRPVLDNDGLRWCCTHVPQHCSQVVAGVER